MAVVYSLPNYRCGAAGALARRRQRQRRVRPHLVAMHRARMRRDGFKSLRIAPRGHLRSACARRAAMKRFEARRHRMIPVAISRALDRAGAYPF